MSIVKTTIAQLNTPKNYNLNNGLPSLKITNIAQDATGYLWFTSDKGIFNFDGQNFTSLTIKDSLISNNTTSILAAKNTLFIGTNNGLSIRKNNKFLNYKEKKINCILTTPQHTFLGTNKGVLRVREDFLSNIRTNFQIDLNIINDIKFDGNFYWVATNKALFKLDKLINPTSIKRIDLGNYTAILIHENNIITTTYNNGISVINNAKVRVISTSLKAINNIKFIDNQFWVTSKTEGIEVFDTDFNFIKTINKYNTLKTNQVNDVFQDQQKNIWIATNNEGVYKIVSKNTVQFKPTITFQNIEVVYKSIDSISINNYQKTLQLKPSENHISFTYKTVDINNPKNVLYRYKLNDEFSKWTRKNTVDLPYLNSGNYTFTAQAKIDEIISNPIKFSFFIDMPLYQKKWFQQLFVLLITVLLIVITFFYVKKIKAKNKTKIDTLKLENHLLSLEQKALQLQMNPHFIFNVLNGIKALGNSENKTALNATISKFATLLRNVLHNSRQEEISLADEIFALKNYVELEQQMNSNLFEFNIITDLNIDADEILIPPMLIQPFIENSIEHGFKNKKNGKITITFSIKNQFLNCTIIDNGIGFYQSKKHQKTKTHDSLAVSITQERIKSLSKKSSFFIDEITKENTITGTKVSFKIPLKTDF
ncbi:histidine kinase [Tenacibaculum insulae]|uniref:sensor histidine kinase n=1 Tax=Tenacibaculum insulae TaxID=2029677 RepID=UPI003AB50E5F